MYRDDAEAAYLVDRVKTSIDMADAAGERCTRHAHDELARRTSAPLMTLLRVETTRAPAQRPLIQYSRTGQSA
jgi:hypothetical protein